jgi:hypothetical protein
MLYAVCHYAKRFYAECHYAKRFYVEYHYVERFVLSVILLNVLIRVLIC